MKITTKKLSELRKPEKNVRIHTEQQLREFERSVKMFGQIRPIVIDENNVILAGNGLYDTLLRLEYEEAEVYQYFDLTENQKKKLMIADNKIFSLGIENLDTLNSFLEDLHDDLDIPGYDSEILKQMVSEADDITEKLSSYGTLDDEEIKAIKEKRHRCRSMEKKIQIPALHTLHQKYLCNLQGIRIMGKMANPPMLRNLSSVLNAVRKYGCKKTRVQH